MPCHEIAEGHIESYLSLCVHVCLIVPESCPAHNFILHGGGFENNLVQNFHDKTICCMQEPCSRSKVKVTVCT